MSDTKPYELRLEMLKMAKDYLDSQTTLAREVFWRQWEANVEAAKKMNQMIPQMGELPKFYSVEDITRMADQFNQFVSGLHKK